MKKWFSAVLASAACALVVVASPSVAAMPAQTGQAPMTPDQARKFCASGLVQTKRGIEIDIGKLRVLKIDPKVIAALDSVGTSQVARMEMACKLLAVNLVTAQQYVDMVGTAVQFAAEAEAVRRNAEKASNTPESPKDAQPPAEVAKDYGLKIVIDPMFKDGGDMTLVVDKQLPRLMQRYVCTCQPQAVSK